MGVAAAALGALALVLELRSTHANPSPSIALDLLLPWAFAAAGSIAMLRRPDNGTGGCCSSSGTCRGAGPSIRGALAIAFSLLGAGVAVAAVATLLAVRAVRRR